MTRLATLSFDDGCWHDFRLLDFLNERKIPATFYIVAGWCDRAHWHRDVAEAVKAYAGHEIGCHTMTHPDLTETSLYDLHSEIITARRVLQDLFQQPVDGFAYPYGIVTEAAAATVKAAGYKWGRTCVFGQATKASAPHRMPVTRFVGPWEPTDVALPTRMHFNGHAYQVCDHNLWNALAEDIHRVQVAGFRFVTNAEYYAEIPQ